MKPYQRRVARAVDPLTLLSPTSSRAGLEQRQPSFNWPSRSVN